MGALILSGDPIPYDLLTRDPGVEFFYYSFLVPRQSPMTGEPCAGYPAAYPSLSETPPEALLVSEALWGKIRAGRQEQAIRLAPPVEKRDPPAHDATFVTEMAKMLGTLLPADHR